MKYEPYKGVRLTSKGKKAALDVVRRHRLLERFLTDRLGVGWDKAHDEAHRMEHGFSRSVGEKLYRMLGNPKTCPHGNPIPDLKGNIHEERSQPLADLSAGDRAKIIKITNEDPSFLRHLAALGLMPGTLLTVEQKAPFKGPILVRINSSVYALGRKLTQSIRVLKI